MKKEDLLNFYNRTALSRTRWKKRNRFYHTSLQRYFRHFVSVGARVIEIGCGPGDLLHALKPAYGVGVDFSPAILEEARKKYPQYTFIEQDAEELTIAEKFDYIILSDLVGCLWDVQKALKNLRPLCDPHTRVIISNYNYLWEPIMLAGERLRLKLPQPRQNWLSTADLETLLYLEDFQLVTVQKKLLFPKYIPILNTIFNRLIGNLPMINNLSLVNLLIARPLYRNEREYSVSVIIPARNEKGNIENAITRTPQFGSHQEFIFVEGHSSDGTFEEMLRVKDSYPGMDIKVIRQSGKGKGNAVRDGFDLATGDILMILDADLTMPPEELPKFYFALRENKGEFVNGCRLVYPMDKQAMRFLNLVANKFFGWFFSHLLGQRLKDTLCGTKVLFRRDYLAIAANRSYFGDFDPFGDFDLLFGAAKLNLKITEIIIRYRDRSYGSTQISRFRHGWLLIKMSIFGARKIKYK
jgi:ubiquinone/menaquinone biosynthesis C-methylase UbiE